MAEIALAFAKTGKPQEAVDFIKRARTQDKDNIGTIYTEGQIYAILGKPSQALESLQLALDKHYPVDSLADDPDLESLHSNPGYQSMIKKYAKNK